LILYWEGNWDKSLQFSDSGGQSFLANEAIPYSEETYVVRIHVLQNGTKIHTFASVGNPKPQEAVKSQMQENRKGYPAAGKNNYQSNNPLLLIAVARVTIQR